MKSMRSADRGRSTLGASSGIVVFGAFLASLRSLLLPPIPLTPQTQVKGAWKKKAKEVRVRREYRTADQVRRVRCGCRYTTARARVGLQPERTVQGCGMAGVPSVVRLSLPQCQCACRVSLTHGCRLGHLTSDLTLAPKLAPGTPAPPRRFWRMLPTGRVVRGPRRSPSWTCEGPRHDW